MGILTRCKTPRARFLLACGDERGVLRFPTHGDTDLPGINIEVSMGSPIGPQLIEAAEKILQQDKLSQTIEIEPSYCEPAGPDEDRVTLYAGTLIAKGNFSAPSSWATLPDLLRGMPKSRDRVTYLKALQVFSGAFKENTKAVSTEDLK